MSEASSPGANTALSGRRLWYPQSRGLSALEFLLGASIVIGHNVYHVVPNEVPILFVLGWISVRLRDGGWKALGLTRPKSRTWTVGIALAAAALRHLMGEFVIDPLAARLLHRAPEVAEFNALTGNLKLALLGLLVVWTFAAFGEELSYRGYLLTRAADLGHRSVAAYWIGMICVSVLFGFGHHSRGWSGVVDSGMAGVILGGAYLLSRRNLWVPILAHGFIDTFAVIVVFFGWQF
ncbi:MAG: lysostaphin resistance A-like protein [Terriglobales bacterium]